jgi:hypothetical protein
MPPRPPRRRPWPAGARVLVAGHGGSWVTYSLPGVLRRAGLRVELLAARGSVLSHSRHLAAFYPAPPRPLELVAALKARLLAEPGRYQWVIPADDETLKALARHRAEAWAAPAFPIAPSHPGFPLLYSKTAFIRLFTRWGLPVPDSSLCRGLTQAKRAAARLGYPCVAKGDFGYGGSVVRIVGGPAALEQAWRELKGPAGVVIQRRVSAPTIAVQALYDHGRLAGWFSVLKVQQWPEGNGPEVRVRPYEPAGLEKLLRRFGRASGYHGWAEPEGFEVPGKGVQFFELNCRVGSVLTHPGHDPDFPAALRSLAGWQTHRQRSTGLKTGPAEDLCWFPDHLVRVIQGRKWAELRHWGPRGLRRSLPWDEPTMLLRGLKTLAGHLWREFIRGRREVPG